MYKKPATATNVTIGGQTIHVDSALEAQTIRWLENHGFSGRWRRLHRGISFRGSHYTPDLELAIEREDGTHRALVEIKPTLRHFTSDYDLLRRMHGIRNYYKTRYFLLFVGETKSWFRIGTTSGSLVPFYDLKPGKLTIRQLEQPFHFPTWRIYDHHYSSRPEIAWKLLVGFTHLLEAFVSAALGTRRRRRKRRH